MEKYFTGSTAYRILAFLIIILSWGLAVGALLSGRALLEVVGMAFFVCKGLELTATIVGLCVNFEKAVILFCGRYAYNKRGMLNLWQSLLRHWWELPQFFVGYLMGMIRVICRKVVAVEVVKGVTIVVSEHRKNNSMGISLGPVVNIVTPIAPQRPIKEMVQSGLGIYRHELGHTIDSMILGWLYLPVIGLPSLVSVLLAEMKIGKHRHEKLYTERWADRHGKWLSEIEKD